jgi:hypothetical protein
VLDHLPHAYVWTTYHALRFIDAQARTPVVCRLLLATPEWWVQNPLMPRILSDFIDARAARGERLDLADVLGRRAPDSLGHFRAMLAKLSTPHAQMLERELEQWLASRVDRDYLGSVERIVDGTRDGRAPSAHARLEASAAGIVAGVLGTPLRSFAVVGETGVGKSTVLRVLASRLTAQGWTVFEANAGDVLAGMVYIGELEGRIKRLVVELDVARRTVWLVPNLAELAHAAAIATRRRARSTTCCPCSSRAGSSCSARRSRTPSRACCSRARACGRSSGRCASSPCLPRTRWTSARRWHAARWRAVEPVGDGPSAEAVAAWTARVAGMYVGWAKKRRMRLAALLDEPARHVFSIGSYGVHHILAPEAGCTCSRPPTVGTRRAAAPRASASCRSRRPHHALGSRRWRARSPRSARSAARGPRSCAVTAIGPHRSCATLPPAGVPGASISSSAATSTCSADRLEGRSRRMRFPWTCARGLLPERQNDHQEDAAVCASRDRGGRGGGGACPLEA